MTYLSRFNLKTVAMICFSTLLFAIASSAQSFKLLLTFDGSDGATPVETPLVQGIDGEFYGTTLGGGANGSGTIFKIGPTGKLMTVYSFCALSNCADGSGPYGGLVLGTDGNFYGTTFSGGGSTSDGTIFKITPSGKLTTLHSFDGTDGRMPVAPLVQGRDGYFYGITQSGGFDLNAGGIFKISPNGSFTNVYFFGAADGSYPTGSLFQANDGNFYGTNEISGLNGYGTIFKMTPAGVFTTFYGFSSTDGSAPASGLIQGSDGYLYGTTYQGGANMDLCPNGCGTVFKISLAGKLTTIQSFDSTNGANPIGALIQATDGNFYGTTYGGGANGWGSVFEMTPSGTITNLHSFTGSDGAQPYAGLVQGTGGNFYGTATNGTANAPNGTAFRLGTGLGPFVKLVQPVRRVGQMVGIIGQGFVGTSDVSINGVSTPFMIRSGSYIAATVPAGATTGFITVTTTSGTLKSNVVLKIVP